MSQSSFLKKSYLAVNSRIWSHLPASLTSLRPVQAYGHHLHNMVQMNASRRQYLGTFFFRNRPELQLLNRLLEGSPQGSAVSLCVLGCSKGAEVYSFSYAVRSARPDLNLRIRAVDIDPDVLGFAEEARYFLVSQDGVVEQDGATKPYRELATRDSEVAANTIRDQARSIFERLSDEEIEALFDRDGNRLRVKPKFREGITWQVGDAADPELVKTLGLQDIVVANRFLCHMNPAEAERCLRNIPGLVKPGGYVFVTGVDLAVRSKVAKDLGWKPVTELLAEIHEGDPTLRRDWPLQYWGLEPFDPARSDALLRYASVFQV